MRSATSRSGALALLLSLAGCGSPAMVEVAVPLPDLPSAGAAMVVFVQPSSYAENEYFSIFDHTGRFLGDSEPATWFAVQLAPGDYEFYSRAQNTAAVRARLAPNRSYLVEVASRPGFFRMRAQLLPIAPRFASWHERETWLAETRAQRSAYASTLDREDIADLIADGQETLDGYDDEELERRTLRASDGI
jgi:hypothetical protein